MFPSLPLVNFLSLLVGACRVGAPEFYNGLKRQYAQNLEEVPWNDVTPPPLSSKVCGLMSRRLRRLGRCGLILRFLDNRGI